MSKALAIVVLVVVFPAWVSAQSGTISGKLVYPGEGIPRDMILCVKAKDLYCSNDKAKILREAKVSFRINLRAATYEIALPAGTYLLYGMTREMLGYKAFYNEFVKCGMSVDCHSKKLITVRVKAGQRVKGITIGDFWD